MKVKEGRQNGRLVFSQLPAFLNDYLPHLPELRDQRIIDKVLCPETVVLIEMCSLGSMT